MNATEEFNRIAQRFPESQPRVEPFSTGATMLDLTIRGEDYCAQYLPSYNVFGLSKTAGTSPFWEGVDETFRSPAALEARIAELLNSQKLEATV